jgi:hypothetical protein
MSKVVVTPNGLVAPARKILIPYKPREWAKPFHDSMLRWAVLILHRRAGKAQPLTAKVLTPGGFVAMGSLKVSDVVMTPSGRRSRIVGIFPQGREDVFRVTMADGSTTRATADHLWKIANRRRKDQVVTTQYLREFLGRERLRTRKNKSRPLIDRMSPAVDFGSSAPLPLNAYVLGLLLSDGGLSGRNNVRFSTEDVEVLEAIRASGARVKRVAGEGHCDYHIQGLNPVIKQLGLSGTKSATKFVPRQYLKAMREDRLALLQGLLDTDGSATAGKSTVEFCSVSKQLASDVQFLARSIGWAATMSPPSIPTFTYKGAKKNGQPRYRVSIRAGAGGPAFRIARKVAANRQYRYALNRQAIVSIEPDGYEECQCIQIDDPESLYVTDDFIVTHNTTSLVNHHIRFAMDDNLERRRLRFLAPHLSDADVTVLLRGRNYGHIMPSYKQAKLVAWDMLKYYSEQIPGIKKNEAELSIKYPTGSKIQLFGADNPDALRGPAFSGVSFDEFSQQDPIVFNEIISKALADHLGYSIWAGTIKGEDHLYTTWQKACQNPEKWLAAWQDIDKSLESESGPTIEMLKQALEDDRELVRQGVMNQSEFDQEWYLSVTASIHGAYYTAELDAAQKEGRVTDVPHDPTMPVDTDWDLGMDDAMVIWFSQRSRGGIVRIIDFYQNSGEGIPHYAQVMRDKRDQYGYGYGEHWAPHDIRVRELNGKSRLETAAEHGIHFKIVPDISFEDGIHSVRMVLPRCLFDKTKCKVGLNSLRNYRRKFNTALKEFYGAAVHNKHSHAADGFRGLAVRLQSPRDRQARNERHEKKAKDVFDSVHAGGAITGWMSR